MSKLQSCYTERPYISPAKKLQAEKLPSYLFSSEVVYSYLYLGLRGIGVKTENY